MGCKSEPQKLFRFSELFFICGQKRQGLFAARAGFYRHVAHRGCGDECMPQIVTNGREFGGSAASRQSVKI
jgi:hypothetical protein